MKPTELKPKARAPWDYREEAKAYHKSTGYLPYTMYWNATLEAQMMDEGFWDESRVLFAAQYFAWGNFSDFAVTCKPQRKPGEPKPKPLTQEALGELIGIKSPHMSKHINFLKRQGYLKSDHPHIFPEKRVNLLESQGNFRSQVTTPCNFDSPYLRFEKEYFEKHPDLAKTVSELEQQRKQLQEEARKATKELRRVKLQALTAWRALQRKADKDTAA